MDRIRLITLQAEVTDDVRAATEAATRAAFTQHLPGQHVWLFGSLAAPCDRFQAASDVDVVVESLLDGRSHDRKRSPTNFRLRLSCIQHG